LEDEMAYNGNAENDKSNGWLLWTKRRKEKVLVKSY
jgi:hypothetical protein